MALRDALNEQGGTEYSAALGTQRSVRADWLRSCNAPQRSSTLAFGIGQPVEHLRRARTTLERSSLEGYHFRREWWKRLFCQVPAGSFITATMLITATTLLLPRAIYVQWKNTEVVGEPTWMCGLLSLEFLTAATFTITLPFCAAFTLLRATSKHLRRVGRYLALLWAAEMVHLFKVAHCRSEDYVQMRWNIALYVAYNVTMLYMLLILAQCVGALERSMLRNLGSRHLFVVLCFVAFFAGLWCILGFSGIREELVGCVGWVGRIAFIYFCSKTIWAFGEGLRLGRSVFRASHGRHAEQANLASRVALSHIVSVLVQCATYMANSMARARTANMAWPLPPIEETGFLVVLFSRVDILAKVLSALLLSGVLSGALNGMKSGDFAAQAKSDAARLRLMLSYSPSIDHGWQRKVQELASRGFTLSELLRFYQGLGTEYMLNYHHSAHTTLDVVRGAIIPLTASRKCAYATLMMGGKPTEPDRMVTHNWSNLFSDLVAAIVADALGEEEFGLVAGMLMRDVSVLERWLVHLDKLHTTYWVCAFSVCQHDGICGSNPYGTTDTVTKQSHPVCSCGKPKIWNSSPPLRADGQSINCELNKFDDMMEYLAARKPQFAQVIAVDASFVLFQRAWCVAEIAMAHSVGMDQHVKVRSQDFLEANKETLQSLQIQNMEASRPEDKVSILSKIPDVDEFNGRLQTLLFRVFANWQNMDASEQLERLGRMSKWQEARSSDSIWVELP